MSSHPYLFPLCIQLAPPTSLTDKSFLDTLSLLQRRGFYGVELNILDFSVSPSELRQLLASYDLKFTMIASGAYAKQNGLSLCSTDESTRTATVSALDQMLSYAAELDAGVICGFIKGGPTGDKNSATEQMGRSLAELAQCGALDKAPLYLEATNHYEALLVNTLSEGACFAQKAEGRVYVLPDTYHMNIEESSTFGALAQHACLYRNVHISDNNRYFPGFGAIDFCAILRFLRAIGYNGTISIEGRNLGTLDEDIAASCDYLLAVAQCAARG